MKETDGAEVLRFIALIRNSAHKLQTLIFTEGACYQFHLILKNRFPESVAYYDMNHVITRIGDGYYDITGEAAAANHTVMETMPTLWGRRFH